MSKPLITEFVADEPLIVVVGMASRLTKRISEAISKQGVQVVDLKTEDISESRQLLNQAYKVVWVNETVNKEDHNYQKTISLLRNYSGQIVVIQPVFSCVSPPSSEDVFGYWWAKKASEQKELILDINYQLTSTLFIFGRDIVNHQDFSLSPLQFVLKDLDKGLIYNPEINWGLQDINAFVDSVGDLLFRPQSAGSFVVSGVEQNSSVSLQKIKTKYEHYHSINVHLRSEPQVLIDTIPFSVTKRQSEIISNSVITNVARSLSRPSNISAPVVENSLKKELKKPEKKDRVIEPEKERQRHVSEENHLLNHGLTAQSSTQQELSTQQQVGEDWDNKLLTQQETRENPPTDQDFSNKKNEDKNKFDVNDELQKIFSSTRVNQRVKRVKNKAKTEKKQHRKKKSRTALFWGGVASIGLALGVIALSIVFITSQFLVKKSLLSVVAEAADQESSDVIETESWNELQSRRKVLSTQLNAYTAIFETSIFSEAALLVELSEQIANMSSSMDETRETTKTLVLQSLGSESGDTAETARKLQSMASKTYENLSMLQAGLGQIGLSEENESTSALLKQYEDKVHDLRQSLVVAQQLDPHLAAMTGADGKKTYAVLLQNNQELRPTGGFIQAVALLNFDQGSLASYQVYSSYEIDSRLSGAVTPPAEVTQYLSEQNWYLRDSNWNPNFPDTAKQVSWFLEKGLGVKVDGVVGINLLTIEDLIEALGPLDVPEYSETLTHRNLQERMEFHSEVVLVPNNETKDYGVIVLEKLIEKMRSMQRQKVPGFLAALGENLETQQMTVTMFDESVHGTFASLGWTGSLIEPLCPTQLSTVDCEVDSIAQIEANVGVNKANYYLKRSIDHLISLGPDAAQHQRIITFENTAKTSAWPKGNYKSYIRFYLPEDVELSDVSLNDKVIPSTELSQSDANGKKVIGVLIDVPIDSQAKLKLNYATPLEHDTPYSYAFFNQKQTGTTETSTKVTIVSPSNLQPTLIAPQAEVNNNTIIFDDINEKHSFVGVMYQ